MKILISEEQFKYLQLRRNFHKIPDYIRSSYRWLNPKAFKDFDDFKSRVIFSAVRDFVWDFVWDSNQDYDALRAKFLPFFEEIVNNVLNSELVDYYQSHFK